MRFELLLVLSHIDSFGDDTTLVVVGDDEDDDENDDDDDDADSGCSLFDR